MVDSLSIVQFKKNLNWHACQTLVTSTLVSSEYLRLHRTDSTTVLFRIHPTASGREQIGIMQQVLVMQLSKPSLQPFFQNIPPALNTVGWAGLRCQITCSCVMVLASDLHSQGVFLEHPQAHPHPDLCWGYFSLRGMRDTLCWKIVPPAVILWY